MNDESPPFSVLVLFAHPDLGASRINRPMLEVARSIDGVTVRDLYALYPDFNIDVRAEQKQCEAHDVIVFQHPFYWYSCPSLLKEWMDEVLTYGWAYGSQATALQGKRLISVISTGGSSDAYSHEGLHGRTVAELLVPFDQMCRLCGLVYLPPFSFHAARGASRDSIDAHARAYRDLLTRLRGGDV